MERRAFSYLKAFIFDLKAEMNFLKQISDASNPESSDGSEIYSTLTLLNVKPCFPE